MVVTIDELQFIGIQLTDTATLEVTLTTTYRLQVSCGSSTKHVIRGSFSLDIGSSSIPGRWHRPSVEHI